MLSNRVPEGVQGGVPDGRLVRWRRDDSAQTPACARSPARHGAATAVGVHRLWCGRGTSWYEGVGASGTSAAAKRFAVRIISTNPPLWVSSYDATCILSVVSTCTCTLSIPTKGL